MGDAGAASAMVLRLNHMIEALPEEKKNGNMGKVISYAANLEKNGWSSAQYHEQLQSNVDELKVVGHVVKEGDTMMHQVWATSERATGLQADDETITKRMKQMIIDYLHYVEENGPKTMKKHLYDNFDSSPEEFYERVEQSGAINEHKNIAKSIAAGIKSYYQIESNKMITNMTTGFANSAVAQFVKFYFSWKEVSNVSYVIQDPFQFGLINNNLEVMEGMVTEVLDRCKSNPNDSGISQTVLRIDAMFTSTLSLISNLKVTFDGHIQCLNFLTDVSFVDGLVNVKDAATQGYHPEHPIGKL